MKQYLIDLVFDLALGLFYGVSFILFLIGIECLMKA